MAELKNISVKHDQIMDWLIANPLLPLSACAAEFGITQSWLSCIIHSDLFQAKLAERQEEVFGEVALSVKDRITTLAHESLRRMTDKVMVENDLEKLTNASEVALKALGFGQPKPGAGVGPQVTVNVVSRDILAEARRRMETKNVTPAPAALEQKVAPAVPATISNAETVID